ncbi:hypothetical protein AUL38_07785 [Leucobacter sp. G161]|nr:hypothetical protein AUL38_07785 [Leucobacter sp. G161]
MSKGFIQIGSCFIVLRQTMLNDLLSEGLVRGSFLVQRRVGCSAMFGGQARPPRPTSTPQPAILDR